MGRVTINAPALLLVLVLSPFPTWLWACSGGGSSTIAFTTEFDGQWEGTWSTATLPPVGTVTLDLEQAGSTITGSAAFSGHPCLSDCTVSCEVGQDALNGRFEGESFSLQFAGSCPDPGHAPGPHHPDALTAAYQIDGGPCTGQNGTMELTWLGSTGSHHHGSPP
jgi:hypothetical protein